MRPRTATRRSRAGGRAPDKPPAAGGRRGSTAPRTRHGARRNRTAARGARIFADVAQHGWTPRDVNQLITDWIGTGHWVPESPHRPVGLLGAILAAHDNPAERPAAIDEAREQAELAAAKQRVAEQLAERDAHRRARDAGRAALEGPGRRAARDVLDGIAGRRRQRRAVRRI